MKTFLALAALLAVSAAPVDATAALSENLFGLFYDEAATVDEIEITPNSQQVLYLVVVNPVSANGNVQMIGGFECSVLPATGDYLLAVAFPTTAINAFGSPDNLMVGFAQAMPVTSGSGVTLATLTVLTMGNNPEGYFLQPASPPSIPNTMAYLDMSSAETLAVNAMPVSGSFDQPVFTFGDYTVEEDRMWGDVKSLYR
ncbi:MAG: hypothetical protein ABFS42_05815 [Candidatus Krumholzibacteriota bacterium]